MKKMTISLMALAIITSGLFAFGQQETSDDFNIAIFVPGVVAGSPTYEMLVEGASKAAKEKGARYQVIEAGFNQGEWPDKLQNLAASGNYQLIITSNPAMPELCREVASIYPEQKFAIIDAHMVGNPAIFTFRFNQMEQAYLAGYFAGLVTQSKREGATSSATVGLLAGQEYPDMNRAIRPGFEMGLRAAAPNGRVIFRVLGNWYDAEQAQNIAKSMFDQDADVILSIAGGGNQGVLAAAQRAGRYVQWFDSNGYAIAPGTIIGSTYIAADKAAYETTIKAINGTLEYGQNIEKSVREGYITFLTEDPLFTEYVLSSIVAQMEAKLEEFRSARLSYPMPNF